MKLSEFVVFNVAIIIYSGCHSSALFAKAALSAVVYRTYLPEQVRGCLFQISAEKMSGYSKKGAQSRGRL